MAFRLASIKWAQRNAPPLRLGAHLSRSDARARTNRHRHILGHFEREVCNAPVNAEQGGGVL